MKKKIFTLFLIVFVSVLCAGNLSYAKPKPSKKNICYLGGEIVEMWNEHVCNFSWYYSCRTDSCGDEMNPDKVLNDWNKNIKRMTKWDKAIKKCKSKKYNKLKKYWKVYFKEYKRLYKRVEHDLPMLKEDNKSYKLNCDKFEKYLYKLDKIDLYKFQ